MGEREGRGERERKREREGGREIERETERGRERARGRQRERGKREGDRWGGDREAEADRQTDKTSTTEAPQLPTTSTETIHQFRLKGDKAITTCKT